MEVTQVIISDHERVKTLYNTYKSERRVNEKQNLARNIIREIKVHSALEETILYPTFRERLPNGNVLADQNLQEHASVEKKLDNLNNMSVADDEVSFDREMALMMQVNLTHIAVLDMILGYIFVVNSYLFFVFSRNCRIISLTRRHSSFH